MIRVHGRRFAISADIRDEVGTAALSILVQSRGVFGAQKTAPYLLGETLPCGVHSS